MADEPENLTIRLLQEIRSAMQAIRSDIHELRGEVKGLTQRVDGNTLILNLVAGIVHDHEYRASGAAEGLTYRSRVAANRTLG